MVVEPKNCSLCSEFKIILLARSQDDAKVFQKFVLRLFFFWNVETRWKLSRKTKLNRRVGPCRARDDDNNAHSYASVLRRVLLETGEWREQCKWREKTATFLLARIYTHTRAVWPKTFVNALKNVRVCFHCRIDFALGRALRTIASPIVFDDNEPILRHSRDCILPFSLPTPRIDAYFFFFSSGNFSHFSVLLPPSTSSTLIRDY